MNCFTYPVSFVIYLAQMCMEFHFILPLSNQARTRFLSVLAWQDNIVLLNKGERIKILASFSYSVSPDSWRGWFEPRYGRTGSPEPSLGQPSPARKSAIYRRSEKKKKMKSHYICTAETLKWNMTTRNQMTLEKCIDLGTSNISVQFFNFVISECDQPKQ